MRLFGLILSLVVLFALPFLLFGDLFTVTPGGNEAVERLESYGRWSWAMGVGLIVGDLVLPIPATAVMAAMGILYGPVGGGLLAGGASFLAGAIAFVATRRFGRGLALKLAGEDELARSERFFARAGGYAVALSRGLPVLPEVTACLAGLSRMTARPLNASNVSGVINRWAASVIATVVWVPRCTKAETTLATLYDAMPPQTHTNTR